MYSSTAVHCKTGLPNFGEGGAKLSLFASSTANAATYGANGANVLGLRDPTKRCPAGRTSSI